MRDDQQLEADIKTLLADERYLDHPLQSALAELFSRYDQQLASLERLTSISDGYQSALRDHNLTMASRYHRQIRQLQKIVRISDHYQDMLRDANEALRTASTQDPLTSLPNRRLMMERLNAEVASAMRHRTPFTIAVVDVDNFKGINDKFGHAAGDAALIAIARRITAELRAYDVCARWGGEEFLVLLPETTGEAAYGLADRLCHVIAKAKFLALPSEQRLSVSIGLAEHAPGADLVASIKRADLALYEAKNAGRNRVILAAAAVPATPITQ